MWILIALFDSIDVGINLIIQRKAREIFTSLTRRSQTTSTCRPNDEQQEDYKIIRNHQGMLEIKLKLKT